MRSPCRRPAPRTGGAFRLLGLAWAFGSASALSLDPTDTSALKAAASQALTNLLTYYTPNSGGVFSQVQTPWHESGMIWGTYMDYAKWSGDTQFMQTITGALANASYNSQQDFLGGSMVTLVETLQGRWNDDILWPSQAVIAGAEIYGPSTVMPGTNGGQWYTAAGKTYDQAYEQWDDGCGGGIYWSRNRQSSSAAYKSVITQLEFIAQGARNYIQQKNETALGLAQSALDWTLGVSGLASSTTGVVYDGMNVGACSQLTTNEWSYNSGQLIGALAWMHKATGNQTYLDLATPFLNHAMTQWAGKSTNGVITETCEADATCNRDQQGFKAILIRNMAYLYRETSDSTVQSTIRTALDTTLAQMVSHSCDESWNCNGNWSTASAGPLKYVRSQHVSAALLVASLGVHSNETGEGLLPAIKAAGLSNASNGDGGHNSGSVESTPLSSAGASEARWTAAAVVGGLVALARLTL